MSEISEAGSGSRKSMMPSRWPCTAAVETGKISSGCLRDNEDGRNNKKTNIDHRNREVYNGSRLGREFSANAFEQLFNRPQEFPEPEFPGQYTSTRESLSDNMESAIEQAFGIFSPDINGPDPQEEALARRLQRKKKKKRRPRGIS